MFTAPSRAMCVCVCVCEGDDYYSLTDAAMNHELKISTFKLQIHVHGGGIIVVVGKVCRYVCRNDDVP